MVMVNWSSSQCPAQSQGPEGEVADKSYPYPLEREVRRNPRKQLNFIKGLNNFFRNIPLT